MLRRARASLGAQRYRFAAAALGGALVAIGFCGLDQWYLTWFAFVPILWALDDRQLSFKESVAIAWLFGLVAHLGVYTWLVGMLRDFGFLPLPLALLGYFLLCLAQSTLFAAWGVSTQRLAQRFNVPLAFAAPVSIVVIEWLWPALFPSYVANSQYERTIFIQSASLWGVLGLSFIVMMASAMLYELGAWMGRRRDRPPLLALGCFVVLLGFALVYGAAKVRDIDDTVAEADRHLRVGLVQTNMGIYEKSRDRNEGLRRHREQSLEVIGQGADVVVWPESGYNYGIRDGTANLADKVLGPITKPVIFGAVRVEPGEQRRYFNSAFLVAGNGDVLGTYDKTYLLAFGEYIPFGEWLPFLYDVSPNTTAFSRGAHTRPLEHDGIKYGMLICYEDILPGFVRDVMQSEPDVLVNITNDAWFGKTREPVIHLALSVFRAVEHRRYLVRATNTGVSAIIDPAGRIVDRTPVFARANLVGDIRPLSGLTLYARFGDWVAWLCLAAVAFWLRAPARAWVAARRRRLGELSSSS
jgi:apolipoprotein N-acyltransferase